MSFIKNALDNKQVVLSITFLIFAFGIYALLTMPRREDPKFNIRQGLIVAAYPGASASQIDTEVTEEIERVLFSYEEVRKEKTYANSRQGVLYIVVELESFVTNADLFWSKLQHRLNLLKLTELPVGLVGPIVESDFGDTIALLISFQSDKRDSRELEVYLEELSNRLRSIRSLSKIKKIGADKECFFVNIDNKKLSEYKIFLPQVIAALKGDNTVFPSGEVTSDGMSLNVRNPARFESIEDLRNQIVGVNPLGGAINLSSVATIERGYEEPKQFIRVNGTESVLMSLEMQNGFNIVDFGKEVESAIDGFKSEIPDDVEIVEIVNQPRSVSESINDFIREFFIAIAAVVVVILLLLPFRVAIIAAAAIPVTVALTFTILDGVGIQLQQVSLASLIVVLGMLVDDAVVIADNYVEKLDEGMDNYSAAWKSANQLKIPMFTAGLTIVGAFAPLLFLTGYVGEFIQSLPITVAIAINASFVVAMFLTPYLCYTFIKGGLKKKDNNRKNFLDYLQIGFDKALEFSFRKPGLIFGFAILSVIAGGCVFLLLNQKLFPAAERDQFVLELRAIEGTSINQVDDYVKKVENYIKEDERIEDYASFVGTSAPRFYYNYAAKFPQSNQAQILINTKSIDDTESMVLNLEETIGSQFPEIDIIVKKMQQGSTVGAPVELRLSGPDLFTLQILGDSLKSILSNATNSSHVVSDFYENRPTVKVETNRSAANQLGFSDGTISRELAVAYQGLPVGEIFEGDNPLSIILQDGEAQSKSIDGLRNFYLTSPISGASVPLSELAEIETEWEASNILRRNGVHTLTVQSQASSTVLPSSILNSIKDRLSAFELPAGYTLSVGGEDESQRETFAEMNQVILYSVFIIFIVILIQFKYLNQVFIVLAAIPLSVFGAFFGLYITGYPFGFTAFVGLASLIGVSVRNSIILVDYANELVKFQKMDIKDAAINAGKRRIRPIFLTTMAAAIGVTPMIISGSPLWAPLATVLAVGLIFSMVMTLLVIPVLYWKFGKIPGDLSIKAATTVVLLMIAVIPSKAQEISLEECILIAQEEDKDLQLLQMEIDKKQIEIDQVRTNLFPKVNLDGGYFWYYNSQRTTDVEISITDLPLIGGIPPIGLGTEFTVPEGNRFIGMANLGIYQPITQLFKVNAASDVKRDEKSILENQYSEVSSKIKEGVAKLYAGMVIESMKIENMTAQSDLVSEQLRQAESAIEQGEVLKLYELGLTADLLDKKTQIEQAKIDRATFLMRLNQILNFNSDSTWTATTIAIDTTAIQNLLVLAVDDSLVVNNYGFKNAQLTERLAQSGVNYYKNQLIPDVTFTAQGFYLENLPIVPRNNVFVGATLSWPILQWGKQQMDVRQADIKLKQAGIRLEQSKRTAEIDIQTKVLELRNSLNLLNTAKRAYDFRQEELRIKTDAFKNGLLAYNDYSDVQKKNLESLTTLTRAKANIIIKQFELKALLGLNE
jgi:multidrug efflux pump subunit AcrB